MSNRVSTALAAIAPSATLAVDAKAKALRAAGENVIGFGAGEPDFPTPEHIVDAAVAACRDAANHRYSPAGGQPALKAALAAKTKRDSGLDWEASQFLVTNGGKQAVYNTMAALVDPGDEVLLPAPYWTTYPEAIGVFGGVPGGGVCWHRVRLSGQRGTTRSCAALQRTKARVVCVAVEPDRRGVLATTRSWRSASGPSNMNSG